METLPHWRAAKQLELEAYASDFTSESDLSNQKIQCRLMTYLMQSRNIQIVICKSNRIFCVLNLCHHGAALVLAFQVNGLSH
jgi:hypothetical protein